VFFQQSKAPTIPELTSTQHFDSLAAQDLSIIFKHSPTCPTSLYAHREVTRFCEIQPDAPVYLVSVRRQRDIAQHVAQCTGVRHESPQIVILRNGGVLAAASHDEITAEWLASAVAPQMLDS
jgi:bacillithiol system protein YtxJ